MIESDVNSFSWAYLAGISVLIFSGDTVFGQGECAGISKGFGGVENWEKAWFRGGCSSPKEWGNTKSG
jgi:hypothetical protein